MRLAIIGFLAGASLFGAMQGENATHTPQLLLPHQRLRRLERDRDRQTARWVEFENAVEGDTNSPERGFELALYYAVTHDANRGREAVAWAMAHPCELRQTALVLDWVADQVSDRERAKLSGGCRFDPARSVVTARDAVFRDIAINQDPSELIAQTAGTVLASLKAGEFRNYDVLYAAAEYLMAARRSEGEDLRRRETQFFAVLPEEFLLSLRPAEVEHPDRMAHFAALALVNLDPNLEGSQYLQGWAMEGRQTLHDGADAAYEFLWGDPYLPGIGYQNLDPWAYDAAGRLFARSDWTPDACWLEISERGAEQQNCPANWRQTMLVFGRLTLLPMAPQCVAIPRRKANETAVVWQLKPNSPVTFDDRASLVKGRADSAGLLRVPANVAGKLCPGE